MILLLGGDSVNKLLVIKKQHLNIYIYTGLFGSSGRIFSRSSPTVTSRINKRTFPRFELKENLILRRLTRPQKVSSIKTRKIEEVLASAGCLIDSGSQPFSGASQSPSSDASRQIAGAQPPKTGASRLTSSVQTLSSGAERQASSTWLPISDFVHLARLLKSPGLAAQRKSILWIW